MRALGGSRVLSRRSIMPMRRFPMVKPSLDGGQNFAFAGGKLTGFWP